MPRGKAYKNWKEHAISKKLILWHCICSVRDDPNLGPKDTDRWISDTAWSAVVSAKANEANPLFEGYKKGDFNRLLAKVPELANTNCFGKENDAFVLKSNMSCHSVLRCFPTKQCAKRLPYAIDKGFVEDGDLKSMKQDLSA